MSFSEPSPLPRPDARGPERRGCHGLGGGRRAREDGSRAPWAPGIPHAARREKNGFYRATWTLPCLPVSSPQGLRSLSED